MHVYKQHPTSGRDKTFPVVPKRVEKVKGYSDSCYFKLQRGHWLGLKMDWITDIFLGDLKRMDKRQVSDVLWYMCSVTCLEKER